MGFTWHIPTKILFGAGKAKQLRNETMPGKRALLITSNGKSTKINGSLELITTQLEESGVEVVLFDQIEANPRKDTLERGAAMAKQENCDFVVGLGGGSVLDAATVISAMATQPVTDIWHYIHGGSGGGNPLDQKPLPYIAITTSAGTGSEADSWGVVTNPETKEKIGFGGDFPLISIVDPELMVTVPPDFTAYQGFDTLFHCIEGYIANTRNIANDMIDLAAIHNVANYLPRAVADGTDIDARERVAFANTMGGFSMVLGSCTSEHSIEHALSGHHPDLPHGAGLIMISLAYFEFFIDQHVCDERFIDMAIALGKMDAEDPMDFLLALKALQDACGVADLKMSDYGIEKEEFETIAHDAVYMMGRLFACDPTELTEKDVIDILEKSYR